MSLIKYFYFFKTRYPIQGPTYPREPIPPPAARAKLCMDLPNEIGTRGGIEPETLKGAHFKISNQPLGEPQMDNIDKILLKKQ